MIQTILSSKYFHIILVVALICCGLYFGSKQVYDTGYTAGVTYQTTIFQQQQAKAKQEFDVLQVKADQERSELNKQIQSLSEQNAKLKKDLENKKKEIQQETKDYAKTTGGSMSCFSPNDDGMFIINKSFPTIN